MQIDKRTYCAKAQGIGNADVFLGRGYEQYNFTISTVSRNLINAVISIAVNMLMSSGA